MEKVIHSLIKEDQTGFIKGRNASDNMRRLLHILDFADSHPTPCAVFSLDAEKAFDRLEWNYMSSQVTFIYIALLTIQIVTKQLHNIKMGK